MPGWPRLAAGVAWPGRREPSLGAIGRLRFRDPHLAARSCRGEHELTGPPRGPGEGDPGGGRPAWQPGEAGGPAGGTLTGVAAPAARGRPGRCGVIGAPAGIPGGPLADLRRGDDRTCGRCPAGAGPVGWRCGRPCFRRPPCGIGCQLRCGPGAAGDPGPGRVLLRACHAACSDGITGLAQAAGPAAGLSRLAAVRLAGADHCARMALRWAALAADGQVSRPWRPA
jgi:hypothetical protein